MTDSCAEYNPMRPSALAGRCPSVVSSHDLQWFVMRVTYSRELKAQQLMQVAGVESFIPMLRKTDDEGEHFVPAIHNLIFVHASREFMDDFKRGAEEVCPLRYMMDKSTNKPMVVRDKEMEDFIRVTTYRKKDVLYLDNPSVAISRGVPVEVVSGPFRGVQGRLLRIRRNRKVVLQLAGVVAVAVDGIPMEWCRVIECFTE